MARILAVLGMAQQLRMEATRARGFTLITLACDVLMVLMETIQIMAMAFTMI